MMIMAFGLGGVFVGVQTAANAGVPPSLAGLAGALASRAPRAVALTSGFHRALLVASIFLAAAAVIALRAANTRGAPTGELADASMPSLAAAPDDHGSRI